MSRIVRGALVQATWTGDKESLIQKHEQYAHEAAKQGAQIILFQALYLLNCRSHTQSIWRIGLFSNGWVYVGIGITLALQLACVYLAPMNRLFHTEPMAATEWALCFAVALVGFLVISLEKRIWNLSRGQGAAQGQPAT